MLFIFISVVILFSLVFIFKDEKEEFIKNLSLLFLILPVILAILLLSYSASGATSFSYLGIFEVSVADISTLLKSFATVSLIALLFYFYSLTRNR